jgi:hypothetical protein
MVTQRLFRGCKTFMEAQELGEGYQRDRITFWTDSLEKAAMYGNYVIRLELDEVPPHFSARKSIAHGNAVHGNIHQWSIPQDYYEKNGGLYCYTEDAKIFIKGLDF